MDPPLELPALLAERPDDTSRDVHAFDVDTSRAPSCPAFRGLVVVRNFLTPSEAADLLARIDDTPFARAQSGKLKQHFGARVNFNKRRLNASAFEGLPDYLPALDRRIRSVFGKPTNPARAWTPEVRRALDDYATTDVFVLRYRAADSSNLDLHIDDTFAYGEAIFDLSLESDSVLTFVRSTRDASGSVSHACVRAPLPARSVAMLFGPARHAWEHGIMHYDIVGRRTSLTLRTLSPALRGTPEGRRVLRIVGADAT